MCVWWKLTFTDIYRKKCNLSKPNYYSGYYSSVILGTSMSVEFPLGFEIKQNKNEHSQKNDQTTNVATAAPPITAAPHLAAAPHLCFAPFLMGRRAAWKKRNSPKEGVGWCLGFIFHVTDAQLAGFTVGAVMWPHYLSFHDVLGQAVGTDGLSVAFPANLQHQVLQDSLDVLLAEFRQFQFRHETLLALLSEDFHLHLAPSLLPVQVHVEENVHLS